MFDLKSESNLFFRIVIVFIGTFIAGLGIQIIVAANLGSDSVSTLILGVLNYTNLSFGRISQIISLIFLIISFFYKKEILGIGSIINAIFLGGFIHLLQPSITQIKSLDSSILAFFIGFFLMAFGTSLYLKANLGAGPLEGIMLSICHLFHLDLKKGRILLDFILVITGILLGSPLKFGTFVGVFILGPIISFFNKLLSEIDIIKVSKALKD